MERTFVGRNSIWRKSPNTVWAWTGVCVFDSGSAVRKFCASVHRAAGGARSEEHTSELQSPCNLVCRLLLEKKKKIILCVHTHMTSISYQRIISPYNFV